MTKAIDTKERKSIESGWMPGLGMVSTPPVVKSSMVIPDDRLTNAERAMPSLKHQPFNKEEKEGDEEENSEDHMLGDEEMPSRKKKKKAVHDEETEEEEMGEDEEMEDEEEEEESSHNKSIADAIVEMIASS